MPPARTTPRGRPSRERARYGLYVALGLAVIVLPVVVLSFVYGSEGDQVDLDANLCPVDPAAIAGHTVLLLDVGKPVSDATAGLAADLLQRVTLDMAANGELKVFLVAANPLAPRILVERLCKPYAGDDLAVATAKDRSGDMRDCDDLPAQLSRQVRKRATQFCARREELGQRIDGIIAGDWPATVANSYLVEAIEDTRLALAQSAHPSLYVFSDMLQHAGWYSHAERGPNKWDYEDFANARGQETGLLSEPPPDDPDLAVTVYYVPRRGLTEHPRVARAHRRFWRRYFADVGSATFEEQPLHAAYEVQPFAEPAQDAASPPVAEVGQEEESAASEAGGPEQQVPAAEPALPVVDDGADPPPVPGPDADAPATVADIEPEVAQDSSAAGNAPAADESLFEDAAATPVQSVDDTLGPVADSDVADPPQPSAGDAPVTTADPAIEPAQPLVDALASSNPSESPDEPPLENPVNDETETVAAPPTAVSPVPVSADPPEPVPADPAELATNAAPTTEEEESFCLANLKPEFQNEDFYPLGGNTRGRRPNFGSADIVVAYTINEDGETVDSDVAVQLSESTVDLPRYTDLFTRRAEQIVRGWSYDFASETDCERRQTRVVRLEFRYRR